jgi:HK97 family phage portal protein
MVQKLVHGNSLFVLEQSPQIGAPPIALWPVDWAQVKILRGTTSPISGYRVETGTVRKTWLPDEVLHFRGPSIDGIAGVSPLQALARTLILEDAAQRSSISSFRNGMRPATAYIVPGRLQQQQRAELEAKLRQQSTGVDARGGNLLLEGGADLKSVTHTAQEAELIMHRKLNREEVAAAYNVDPTQIGILDRATFSNVEEAHRGFYMDTLGPEATLVEDAFGTQLISRYFDFEGTFVEFDMADVLKGNLETRFEAYAKSLTAGWITRNEIRALENLPPVDDRGADSLYAPLNMVALDGRIPSNSDTPVGTPPLAS